MNNLLGASVEINLFLLYFYVSLLILSALILNTNLMQKQEQKKQEQEQQQNLSGYLSLVASLDLFLKFFIL